MKIVLDTNVLLAAFMAHGTCNELLEHCVRQHEIVLSKAILDEFRDALAKKFDFTPTDALKAVSLLMSHVTLVEPMRLPREVCRDPDDDAVWATALAGGCQCLVTGDKDLLELVHFEDIRIVAPSAFWKFETEIEPPT